MDPSSTSLRPLSLLCVGDSLTEGYSRWGTKFTPYSTELFSQLQGRWPEGSRDISIETDGVSGDLLTEGFEGRLKRHCK